MADYDRSTGAPIDNLTSALQSLEILFTIRIASLAMLREFGAGVIELLGRRITRKLFPIFLQLVATAIDLWEPRFKVRRIVPSGSVDDIRKGILKVSIEVDFRPRGHLGDETVERRLNFSMTFRKSGVSVLNEGIVA
ncbi:MAG TPA: GPW/gp25 family protein [Shinella sp.]|uniref:GPW/gp25 family protein n=1 Tax=Shinella sp. TaxID=1870904 RepID=UPI002E1161C2|nr:GPW/gp25 family protein [Shinella sp.]